MDLLGKNLIAGEPSAEGTDTFHAADPRDASALEPAFASATPSEVSRAVEAAAAAHPTFEAAGREARARLLEAVADGIEALGSPLLERASAETGLPLGRFEGERGRTCGQLRLFAKVAREGSYLGMRIDHGDPSREPLPRPDVRSMGRALGPVAVFGASNFPLAFSVAGGDTAAALAAGCPVVVKAHPNHPGTSELVGRVMTEAVAACGLPAGVFSLVQGPGAEVGLGLVRHPATSAVGFTGSLRGGRALYDEAARREVPIPVFAEMGSTNPLFVLPDRMATGGEDLATALAGSVTLGVGQFCTNPGLVVVQEGEGTDAFVSTLTSALAAADEAAMLHAGIRAGYDARLDEVSAVEGVTVLERTAPAGPCGARAALLSVSASTFLENPTLQDEVFGPSTMVVRCRDHEQALAVARALPGQLTATLHAGPGDGELVPSLLALLEQRAGRVLCGGFPTGVEVCDAMVHGGPYPATTDSRSTSVGTGAITRFTRPVAYQNFPEELLPEELRDDAPQGLQRLVDGAWQRSG